MGIKIFDICFIVSIILTLIEPTLSYVEKPGPRYPSTKGEVWPKPQHQIKFETKLLIEPYGFNVEIVGTQSSLITRAVERCRFYIFQLGLEPEISQNNIKRKKREIHLANDEETFGTLFINMTGPEEAWPSLEMDESYYLEINNDGNLTANSVWGVLRGIETFSQLVYRDQPFNPNIFINYTYIYDFPRFPHRGLLLDTSRHFIIVSKIYDILRGMSYNKMNVFHWHIVDDQSFPYESMKFPELSKQGSFGFLHTYSPSQINSVIDYARIRGIRVIPEFDTPGHTRSWGVAYPKLLTECYTNDVPNGDLGPMNPASEELFLFMRDFLEEVVEVFPDKYIHLGGDEVESNCWKSNSNITEYMSANNITSYRNLERFYIEKIFDMTNNLNATPVVWHDVFLNGANLPPGTAVQVWNGVWQLTILEITRRGYPVLLSACWYLDRLLSGGDWRLFYHCDPHDFPGSQSQKELVIGGEACMWGEVVDNNNVIQRIFPRVSAVAERLWSNESVNNYTEARYRLEEQYCRMNKRGVYAQPPNGPGFCY